MAEIQTPGGLFDGDGAYPDQVTPASVTDIDRETVYNYLAEILRSADYVTLSGDGTNITISSADTQRTNEEIRDQAALEIAEDVNATFLQNLISGGPGVNIELSGDNLRLVFDIEAPLQVPVQNNVLSGGDQLIDAEGNVEVTIQPPVGGEVTAVDVVTVTGPDGTTVDNDMVTTTVNDDGTATVTVDTQDNPGDYNVDVTTTVMQGGQEMLDSQQTTVTAQAMIYNSVQATQPATLSEFGAGALFTGIANITFNGGQTGSAYIAVQTGKTYTFKTGIFFADSEMVTTVEGYDVYRINDFADIDPGAANTLTIEVVEV